MKLLNNLYCIDTIDRSEEGLLVSIRLIGDSLIYKAHFPMQPVTPGACVVQMAVEMYEGFMVHGSWFMVQGSNSQDPIAKSQEPRAKGQGPRDKGQGTRDKGIEIVKVRNAKFLHAMLPGGGRVFRYAIRDASAGQGLTELQVVVTSGDVTYARLSLICKEN